MVHCRHCGTRIVKAAIGYICKAALPFLGPAMNIANGVAQMVSAAKTRIEAALLRRHFVIQAGHPERLASSIESAMNWAIGTGLWTSLKGAVSLGATFASAGASVLANVIAAALEFVTKTIMRLREAHQMTWLWNSHKSLLGLYGEIYRPRFGCSPDTREAG